LPAQVIFNRFIEIEAAQVNGLGHDDAAQGKDSHIRRAAADVDDHVAYGIVYGHVDAHSRGNGRVNEIGFLGSGLIDGFHDGPLFDVGRRSRHADHDAQALDTADAFAEDVAQHRPRHAVVGDDAV
jgi:hypothetical protein